MVSFTSGDTNPVIPLVNANNPDITGWRTAILLFNMGDLSSDVTLTYVKTDGTTCTETQTVPSKQSKTFAGNNLITGEKYDKRKIHYNTFEELWEAFSFRRPTESMYYLFIEDKYKEYIISGFREILRKKSKTEVEINELIKRRFRNGFRN